MVKDSWTVVRGNSAMKNPLWIINSSFVILLLIAGVCMLALKTRPPQRTSIIPLAKTNYQESDTSGVDQKLIYENDLFGTFVRPTIAEEQVGLKKEPVAQLPPAPPTIPVPEPTSKLIDALPPLPVKLKGVMFDSNPLYRRAIIADAKTKEEKIYKIGDAIEDALLINLSKNKSIFIRSNGQQETLFVSEDDAQKDALYMQDKDLASVVTKISGNTYQIDPKEFTKHIRTIANLIDTLELTLAIDNGKTLGFRVGQLSPQSLGALLGLESRDVITAINGIQTLTTKDRVEIYNHIVAAGKTQTVTVNLLRNESPMTITYKVKKSIATDTEAAQKKRLPSGLEVIEAPSENTVVATAQSTAPMVPEHPALEQKAIEVAEHAIAESATHDAVTQSLQTRDAKNMAEFGGRNAVLQR